LAKALENKQKALILFYLLPLKSIIAQIITLAQAKKNSKNKQKKKQKSAAAGLCIPGYKSV
jgi:DNA polymerase III delta subunit